MKFVCKKINNAADTVETVSDYMSRHCDLDIEDSKPIILLDTLAHDGSSSQNKKIGWFTVLWSKQNKQKR